MSDPLDPRLEALADAIGAHALPVFAVALGVLLAATALLWWGLRRLVVPRPASALPPIAFLAVRLALGFALVVAGAAAFAELAEQLHADEHLSRLDKRFTAALRRTVSPGTLGLFALLTRMGDVATLVGLAAIVTAALLWHRRGALALAWLLALGGQALLTTVLKAVFARVRPVHEHGLVLEHGFSFPSGHSAGAVVAYGMLAYLLLRHLRSAWHLPVLLAATTTAFAVGCSRVFLQVHYASDVLAGFAAGLMWLAVCVTSIELMRHYRRRP